MTIHNEYYKPDLIITVNNEVGYIETESETYQTVYCPFCGEKLSDINLVDFAELPTVYRNCTDGHVYIIHDEGEVPINYDPRTGAPYMSSHDYGHICCGLINMKEDDDNVYAQANLWWADEHKCWIILHDGVEYYPIKACPGCGMRME